MSLEQVFKCANIGCANTIPAKFHGVNYRKFCKSCRFKARNGRIAKNLIWKCSGCDNIITGNVQKRTCQACQKKRRERIAKSFSLRAKIARRLKRKCKNCNGRIEIEKPGYFCSDYCKWIKTLKYTHPKLVLRIRDVD